MLETERNADDGDAADEAESEMGHGNLPPTEKNPKDIHKDVETSGSIVSFYDFSAERPQGESTEFPQLKAERDTDDGNAEEKAYQEISERNQESAQHEPENVTDEFHMIANSK